MPFDLQPTLTGELLELRPLVPEDWEALFAVASDPMIWEQHPVKDRCTEPVFREFFAGALESGGAFAVIDRATGEVIGSTRFSGYVEGGDQVEIGWTFLARKYWGGRYNGEMKRLMMDHAFRFVERVIFLIGVENWRSRKACEKIGGVYVGERKNRTGIQSAVYEISRIRYQASLAATLRARAGALP